MESSEVVNDITCKDDDLSEYETGSSDDSDIDPSQFVQNELLNISSPNFSSFLALRLESSSLMNSLIPDVPVYLNLYEYKKVVEAKAAEEVKLNAQINEPKTLEAKDPRFPIPGRRFLPHQLPIKITRELQPTVLTQMNSHTGPLKALKEAIVRKQRIKVWTRSIGGIRGFYTGILIAFDNHWNLAMKDVDELSLRKKVTPNPKSKFKHRKSQSGNEEKLVVEGDDPLFLLRSKLKKMKVEDREEAQMTRSQMKKKNVKFLSETYKDCNDYVIVGLTHNMEIVKQHLAQYLLMGDSVVFIETNWSPP